MRIWTVLVGLVLLSFATPAYADEPTDNGSAAAATSDDDESSVPADPAADKAFDQELAGVLHEVGQAGPEMSVDKFRKLVSTARAKVLGKMGAKIKTKSAQRTRRRPVSCSSACSA